MDYTVQDTETGKTVTFAWYGNKPPTDADMSDVFAKAKGAIATKYVDNTDIKTAVDKLANDEFTAIPGPSISQGKPASLWDKFFETFEPSWEARRAQAAISMQKARETGKPPSYFEPTTGQAIESGFQSSVSGLLYRGEKPDKLSPEQLKELPATQRILAQGAQLAGDLPFMVPGAIIGSVGGGPAAPLTALGGAFALPSGIRKVLMDKYEEGEIDSFGEFWRRTIGAADETLKGFATGVATGAAGAIGGFPAEIAAMVTVGSALEGQIPEPNDFIDAAILIGGMKMSTGVARKLRTIYADTGKTPNDILMDISEDPFIRKELLQDKETIPEVYQKAKKVSKVEKPAAEPETGKKPWEMTKKEFVSKNPHVWHEGYSKESRSGAFDKLSNDAEVWVYHATDNATADAFLANGIKISDKPRTLTREQFKAGEGTHFAPGKGLGEGLYVGSDPLNVDGYGRRVLAIKVKKGDIQISPEQSMLGEKSVGEALSLSDASVISDIAPSQIIDVSTGKAGKSAHETFVKKALSEGKPVPPEVLKDYPELMKEPTLMETYETLKDEKGYSSVEIADLRDRLFPGTIEDRPERQAKMERIIKGDPEHFATASGDWSLSNEHIRSGAVEILPGKKDLLVKVREGAKIEGKKPEPTAEKVEPAPAQEAVAPKTIQDIDSEFSKEIDTVAKEMAQRGSVGIGEKPTATMFTFSNPEIEARIQAAKGIKSDSFWQTVKDKFVSFGHKMTREYDALPKTAEFAQLQFDLRKLAKQKGVTGHDTLMAIQGITLHLDKPGYNLFWRKVLLDDLAQVAKEGKPLPFGFDKNTLKTEKALLDKAVEKSPAVKDALERRSTVWTALKNDYTKSMEAIGFDVSKKLNREDYFRHQVLDYMELKNITGTGRKLKTPAGRGFLKKRKGSELDINTDYIQAEHEVMAQMLYDLQVAKTIDAVNRNYNIADVIRKQAKAKNLENWRDAIPDSYDTWQPRQGSIFYLADSIPAKLAEMLQSGALEEIGLTKDQIGKVLAVGGKRKEYVLKNEIIDTLNNLTAEKADNPISTAHAKIIRSWKIWQLISPRRYFKYNPRNLTGDADGIFAGRPSVFMETPNAVKELWGLYAQGKTMQGDLRDWFERGGMQSNLQAQEMGELNQLGMFMHLHEQKTGLTKIPLKVWQTYWKAARLSTDFRESILRFAAYKRFLKEMTASSDGMPKDFAASIPEEVRGLKDIKDRAYMMSNDLLGAYDRVGIMGQNIREHLFPFWSWKEANFRRYTRLFKNAAASDQVCELIGRKAVGTLAKTPFTAIRIGKFLLKATAFWSALQVWNNTKFKEEEDMLPPEVKNRPHIVLGRNADGEILAFTRVGALGDLLDWFGLGVAPQYIDALMKGKMTPKEIAIDMAKSPANIVVQGGEPFVKLGAELLSRRAIFPDVFNLRTVRDRSLHVMRSVGLENEYIALMQKPSKGYLESLQGFFIYKYDPIQIAYNDFMVLKRKFLETKGEGSEGFWLTSRGNALYDAKLALRYKDDNAAMNAIAKYFDLGGKLEGIKKSIDNMAPLAGLTQQEKRELRDSLDNEDLRTLIKAQLFFEELQTGQDMSKLIYGKQQ